MSITRRTFLEATAVSSLATSVSAAGAMPTRTLGKTGANVSILAFGSGSRFLAYKDEDKALAALTKALDLGITYVDTAYGYGDGQSETWVGKVVPARRKGVFLATKVNVRKADDAMRIIDGSLKRLQTNPDLIHIHSLSGPEDLAEIEAKDGVLQLLYKLRDQKVMRFVGITSHTDPVVLKTALERHDFDCTQMALNAARIGNANGVNYSESNSFETLALPVAKRKNMGVLAMKIFGQEKLSGKAPSEKLIQYTLSLPVAAAVIGMPKVEFIEQNVAVAKSFRPLPADEMKGLSGELSGAHKASLDRFFADHVDA